MKKQILIIFLFGAIQFSNQVLGMQSQSDPALDLSILLEKAIKEGKVAIIKTLIEAGVTIDGKRKEHAINSYGEWALSAWLIEPNAATCMRDFYNRFANNPKNDAIAELKQKIDAAEKTRAERDARVKAALIYPEHIMPKVIADVIVSYKP